MSHIQVGETLPSIDLYEETPANIRNIAALVRGKRAIIFGVPSAFVPGCSKVHLRGFINKSEELKSRGYEEIICISVNDPYVLSAWGWSKGVNGKVRILADPTARYTNAIRMNIMKPELGGVRSRLYSMITDNGVIKELYVEGANAEYSCLQHSSDVSS